MRNRGRAQTRWGWFNPKSFQMENVGSPPKKRHQGEFPLREFQPSSHHIPPRCRIAATLGFLGSRSGWGQAECPLLHGGGCEEPKTTPNLPKYPKNALGMLQQASPGGQVPLQGDGIGQRELGFMENTALAPGNPHRSSLRVPSTQRCHQHGAHVDISLR